MGLHPGSFAVALILRDRAWAFERAHPLLRADGEIIDEMLGWVAENIPATLFTTTEEIGQWCSHGGLRNAPPNDQLHLYMMSNWWKPKPVAATA